MSNQININRKEIEQLNLRSEEVREIMGHIPSRLIRYGITIIFFVVTSIFIGSFLFRYPDIIKAKFEIVTQNPPAEIIAKSNGNLSHIYVVDSQYVHVNHLLGVVQNPAVTDDVLSLHLSLPNIKDHLLSPDLYKILPDSFQLGELQSYYSALLKASIGYKQFIELMYYDKKIKVLKQKERQLQLYLINSNEQVSLKEAELKLTKKQYVRDSILFTKDLNSASDFETSKKTYIQEQIALKTQKSTAINIELQLNELDQQIVEYKLEEEKQANKHSQELIEVYKNLDSRVAWWFDKYVLISPIEGNVAFNKFWSNNLYISDGVQVFSIIPFKQHTVIGRVNIKPTGLGKIKPGQAVNLKFNNYPYQEFGMIQAKVKTISLLPVDDEYYLELDLPDTLVTNYGFTISFGQKMSGVAEIITEDLPLIARFFNPIKDILKSRSMRALYQNVSQK